MILSEVRQYIKTQRRVTLHDLMLHFDMDAQALSGMLTLLVAKGKLEKKSPTNACGTGCCKCDSALIEIYEWREIQ